MTQDEVEAMAKARGITKESVIREQRNFLKAGKQDAAHLVTTKLAIKAWRTARSTIPETNQMRSELISEYWLLAAAAARSEWGPETTLDDFSTEGKVIVDNGRKRVEI